MGRHAPPAGQLALGSPPHALTRRPGPGRGSPPLALSWGLGVDSTAYLVEVLSRPERHGVDLTRMVVLHAVVGSEWASTISDAERHVLPALAASGVRLVQVARAGPRERDGIVVLSDSRATRRLRRRGPWTLADECRLTGTVPQLSHRRCSLKFKGWPLDVFGKENGSHPGKAIESHFRGARTAATRVSGQLRRPVAPVPPWPAVAPKLVARVASEQAVENTLDQWLAANMGERPYTHVIGFNADEQKRAARDLVYASATRRPAHPLIVWGWTRQMCLERLQAAFGVRWQKSACTFCPYAGGTSLAETLTRMARSPEEAATALLLEHAAEALNPRSKLYGAHSLAERLQAADGHAALGLMRRQLRDQPWSVYRVRRLFRAAGGDPARKGAVLRHVTPVFDGDHTTARQFLADLARRHRQPEDDAGPHPRVWLRHQRDYPAYPRAEEFYVATLAGVAPKSRDSFEETWRRDLLEDALFPRR